MRRDEEISSLLLLFSSGGGGLIQAANAQEQIFRDKNPKISVFRYDVLLQWAPFGIGAWGVRRWDEAHKTGKSGIQAFFTRFIAAAEFILAPFLFVQMLKALFKHRPDLVVDTWPLSAGTVKALRLYNWLEKRDVRYRKIMVDLPTEGAVHYLTPLKLLTKRDKEIFSLHTIEPLTKKGESAADFWWRMARLEEKEVVISQNLVRPVFQKYLERKRDPFASKIEVKVEKGEECELLQKALARSFVPAQWIPGGAIFSLDPSWRVATLLLGSHPSYQATIEYVKAFFEQQPLRPSLLFVLAGKHTPSKKSLFAEVAALASEKGSSKLAVIPLTFQTEEVIAALFHRSDLTCTRSGGHTLMELMTAMKGGEMWIHSSAKKKGRKALLAGIPTYEADNALYMEERFQAKIVTPSMAKELFQEAEAPLMQTLMNASHPLSL